MGLQLSLKPGNMMKAKQRLATVYRPRAGAGGGQHITNLSRMKGQLMCAKAQRQTPIPGLGLWMLSYVLSLMDNTALQRVPVFPVVFPLNSLLRHIPPYLRSQEK